MYVLRQLFDGALLVVFGLVCGTVCTLAAVVSLDGLWCSRCGCACYCNCDCCGCDDEEEDEDLDAGDT